MNRMDPRVGSKDSTNHRLVDYLFHHYLMINDFIAYWGAVYIRGLWYYQFGSSEQTSVESDYLV